MNSQTVRQPDNKRPIRPNKSKKYIKQTARFEGRRDGKPLIFGWGGHLSHKEKVQLQRRATWVTAIVVGLLIVAVFVGYWININIITPGLPITSVNGHQIPQSLYRKMAAFDAQLESNKLYGANGLTAKSKNMTKQLADEQKQFDTLTKQVNDLNTQIKKLPANSSQLPALKQQLKDVQKQQADQQSKASLLAQQIQQINKNDIPQQQTRYTQSQVANDSATWLQNDELIREWLQKQSSSIQAQINPSSSAIAHALSDFKANLPVGTSYNAYLSKDGVSDGDIQQMVAIKVRRDNMQTYLASQVQSPTYQVLARTMTIDTKAHAQQILKQLTDKSHPADFGALAKQKSVDTNTNTQGGSLGWLARGQYAQTYSQAIVENWMFDRSRTIDEISPVMLENGSYHITQILGIDPSRAVDKTTLQSLETNALSNWLLEQQALPSITMTPLDQDKLLDPANLPSDLHAGAPSPNGPGGAPGIPGGVPAQP
ncbi:MAG: peptidylprolyl isomerase [Chloroflexota bacterium]|nr:peptidylprolyl isomerase [Chloroflexota bacterium]